MNRTVTKIALCLATLHAVGHAQPATAPDLGGRPIGLAEALGLALEYSPDLAVYGWDTQIAEARRLQAGVRPNPELALEVEDVRISDGPALTTIHRGISTNGLFVGRDSEDGGASGFQEAEFTLRFTQLIELGKKRAKRIAAGEREIDVAEWDYEIARANTVTTAANAFITVLAAQERVLRSEESLQLARDFEKTINIRVDAGRSSPIESDRVAGLVIDSEIVAANEQSRLAAARQSLAASWGDTEPTFGAALGSLEEIASPPKFEALHEAFLELPDMQRWSAELDRRDALLTLERARRVPDLTVGLGLRATGFDDRSASRYELSTEPFALLGRNRASFDDSWDNSLVFELSIPLPLSNRNQGAIKEAQFSVSQAESLKFAATQRLQSALRLGIEEISAAYHETTALTNDLIPAAQRAFDATAEGYREGKFGYLDVLDAQRTLVAARLRRADALARYHHARVQLERLTGETMSNVETEEERTEP